MRVGVYINEEDLDTIKKHCDDYGKKLSPFLVKCTLKYIEDLPPETRTYSRKRRIFGL